LGPVKAQVAAPTDSITRALNQRLLQGPVPAALRVVQVREGLGEALRANQVRQVPKLLDYLERTVPDSIPRFQYYELWGLLAASGQFKPFLNQVAADNPFDMRPAFGHRRPPADNLFELTQAYLARHLDELSSRARQAKFQPEDSTFLQLGLQLLALGRNPVPENLNLDLQRFLSKYPRSNYGYFVSRMVRPEYEPSRFSYGLDFHSGTGFFTGGLNEVFRPLHNVGHGFEFGWDRYFLYLRNYIGSAETRVPYTRNGRTWAAGQRLNYFVPEISVGYRLLESKWLVVTPFVGLSWCNFAPTPADVKKNPDIDTDVTMSGPITAGLNLDVLLWKTNSGMEVGSWMLKIRSGVRPARGPDPQTAQGGLLYLDIGIGGFGRMLRPKKVEALP
jgi:hypothetical protein